ncbi:hypothetical protein ABPG72_010180 [Tetrahymena utriculariae]
MFSEDNIISSAKVETEKKSEYPDVEESFSYENFEKYILNSNENFTNLLSFIRKIELQDLQIRFNTWRILLGVLKADSTDEEKKQQIEKDRQVYKELWEKYKSKQQPPEVDKPKPVFNPLMKNTQNSPWNGYFEDNELRSDIKKDVERTYQDKQFFVNLKIKNMLTNVLFVFCKKNSDVSYKQGMNEVAASFIIVYFVEALYIQKHQKEAGASQRSLEMAQFMMNMNYAEADIYTLFCKMMDIGHLEMFRPYLAENSKKKQEYNINSKKSQAILLRISKIQDNYLKIVDLELFKHMKLLNVEFQIFLLRWIRCVHTREYHLDDSFKIWDNIFYEYFLNPTIENDFFLIDCICLAMMQYVRGQLMEKEEQSDCLQRFLKYPPVENIKPIVDVAFKIKDIITKGLNEKEDLYLQSLQTKEQDKEENRVVKTKQQGNKNLILFSSGFASKSSNISQASSSIKDIQIQAKKQRKGIFEENSDGEIENDQKEEQYPSKPSQETHAKSEEPHRKQQKKKVDLSDDEEEDSKPAQKNLSGVGFPVASFSHKAASIETNQNQKKKPRPVVFPDFQKEEQEAEKPAFVPPYQQQQKQQSQQKEEQQTIIAQSNTSKVNESPLFENSSSNSVGGVYFKSSEISNMTKKLGSSLDILNYIFSKDLKNENLKKAIEDIEFIERELKKKANPSQAPIFSTSQAGSNQSFVTSSSQKNKPILFSSGTQEDKPKNSVKIEQSTGFVVYKTNLNE